MILSHRVSVATIPFARASKNTAFRHGFRTMANDDCRCAVEGIHGRGDYSVMRTRKKSPTAGRKNRRSHSVSYLRLTSGTSSFKSPYGIIGKDSMASEFRTSFCVLLDGRMRLPSCHQQWWPTIVTSNGIVVTVLARCIMHGKPSLLLQPRVI